MIGGVPFGLVFRLALRSVLTHARKSLFVGGILFGGTLLVVTGNALLSSVERAMAQSITSSMSGQLQIYDSQAKDELALFGSFGMGRADIGEIPDIAAVESVLGQVDGVKGIVPMGITITTVFTRTELDTVLDGLRGAVRSGDRAALDKAVSQVRRIAASFLAELDVREAVSSDDEAKARDREALAVVGQDDFWAPVLAGEGQTPEAMAALDYLDTRLAPQAADGRLLYLRVIGTDPAAYQAAFDRFYIVKGQAIPEGERGFLFSERTYEKLVKNLVARQLDDIRKQVVEEGAKIATDQLLSEQVGRLAKQYQRVVFQLSPEDAQRLTEQLRALMPGEEGSLDQLVQRFLTITDENLEQRYTFFYDVIAPMIQLYDVPVGSTITLRAFTRSGYLKAVNVKVWGTYELQGLERSDLAGASNLSDLVTFRELYGKMSEAQQAELAGIKEAAGVTDVSREDAEAALFGGGGTLVADVGDGPAAALDQAPLTAARGPDSTDLSQQMKTGLALNAAVLLDNPRDINGAKARIEAAIKDAGLNLQVVDWEKASGLVGQFIMVMRAVLYISLLIIFLVALIIVNNAMVMATVERTGEIGTMRAIGAQRGMVVSLFVTETLLLGLFSGALGVGVAAAFIGWLHQVGIPAVQDILVLLFAGPRLFPSMGPGDVALGLGSILLAAAISSLYPALLAAGTPPVVAMQGKE